MGRGWEWTGLDGGGFLDESNVSSANTSFHSMYARNGRRAFAWVQQLLAGRNCCVHVT